MKCDFCIIFKGVKQIVDSSSKLDKQHKYEYKAALVCEDYYRGISCGKVMHSGYDLNFCPVCGKQLKEIQE